MKQACREVLNGGDAARNKTVKSQEMSSTPFELAIAFAMYVVSETTEIRDAMAFEAVGFDAENNQCDMLFVWSRWPQLRYFQHPPKALGLGSASRFRRQAIFAGF